jgi:hypothetical protein
MTIAHQCQREGCTGSMLADWNREERCTACSRPLPSMAMPTVERRMPEAHTVNSRQHVLRPPANLGVVVHRKREGRVDAAAEMLRDGLTPRGIANRLRIGLSTAARYVDEVKRRRRT